MCALELEQPAKILVVDDVQQNLVAIEAALTGLNCELVMATSGPQALRFLLEQDFALILLDVQMPSMDGFETATMIRGRKRTRHVPIIFVTAYGRNDDDVNAAYRLGAVDFLFKPVSAEVVRAKASVFVELQRRNAEVARQSVLLKQNAEMIREKALAAQRRRLEAEALRQRLAEQKVHTVALSQKNSELEHIRAEFEASNLRLEEADRKKDEFIAILAHELRNPLAAMVSGVELLKSEPSVEGIATIRAVMQRQCSHLSRLVDDLLDVSRLTSGKMKLQREQVCVSELLTEAVEFMRTSIEDRKHELEVRCEIPDARVYGDSVRLLQIVVNLLSNAVRYTDPGGRICLWAAKEDEGDGMRIGVRDNGRGMSQELMDSVFNMFFQAESGGDGLGIGLTMVRDLATMHGGNVTAHSDGPGLGSEFCVTFPALETAMSSEVATNSLEAPRILPLKAIVASSLVIAVIDDHDDLRELTRALLERWGHQVFEAPTGLEGVALVVDKRPDLAIIDIGLPDITGYEVAERIRKTLGDECPRLIAMSGYAQPHDRKRSKEAGFDLHLSKPVKPSSLQETLYPAATKPKPSQEQN